MMDNQNWYIDSMLCSHRMLLFTRFSTTSNELKNLDFQAIMEKHWQGNMQCAQRMDFYGLLLYAQEVWIYTWCQTRMDLYVFLFFPKHLQISLDSMHFFYL